MDFHLFPAPVMGSVPNGDPVQAKRVGGVIRYGILGLVDGVSA